jgi:hypothetical protein
MRMNPIATTIASVFVVAIGVFAVYMAAAHLQGLDSQKPALVLGVVFVVLGVVGFWINRKAWL